MTPFETAHHRALLLIDKMTEDTPYDTDEEDFADSDTFNDLIAQLAESRPEAIAKATELIEDADPRERYFAINLFGQLCNPVEEGQREEAEAIIELLTKKTDGETDPACLEGIANSLGYPHMATAEPALLRLSYSDDDEVRTSATRSLGSIPDDEASDKWQPRLIELSDDRDTGIRDWATFDLAMIEHPDVAVVTALKRRLWDKDASTRSEAIRGLATVNDTAGMVTLIEHLESGEASEVDIEAAGLYGDPALFSLLKEYESDDDDYRLEWARLRCSSDASVRASVDDEFGSNDAYLHVKAGKRPPTHYRTDHLK